MQVEVVVVGKVLRFKFFSMKGIIFLFFLFTTALIACDEPKEIAISNNKSVTPEWFGKTDSQVIERFKDPTFVTFDSINRKNFYYIFNNDYKYDSITFTKCNTSRKFNKLFIFYFDSTNIVYNSKFALGEKELMKDGFLYQKKY